MTNALNKEKLVLDLIADEGMVLEPYQDSVDKLTIGVGRNLDDRGISKSEAMFMLANDIEIVEVELDARLGWWRGLPDDAQRALANMAFNMGVPCLLTFSLALGHLVNREFKQAADEFLRSRWAEQVGNRAIRVTDLIRNVAH